MGGTWYWVETGSPFNACGALVIAGNLVVDACPYYRWTIGKMFPQVLEQMNYKEAKKIEEQLHGRNR